jgi:hypothetical protein
MNACSTQKPESMITTLPECMIDSQRLKSSPAVLPFSSNFLGDVDVVSPSLLQAQWNI